VRRRQIGILAVIAALAVPATALAQLPPAPTGPVGDPADTAKVRIGPLFLQPEFGLKDVGLDNNVFNEADPQQDWTGTLSLGMLAGLRFGPARLTVKTLSDYVYYAHFKDERSIDGQTRYQFEVRTARLRPWIAYEKAKTHTRPGYEIDARAGRVIPTYEVGAELKIGFRLATRLSARQRKTDYQDDENFRGVDLEQALDMTSRDALAELHYELSPLSTIRFSTLVQQSRFETATIRDADDIAFTLGIEGRQGAGMEGHVDVGWKERKPVDPAAPAYSGLIARGSAAIILFEEVRVAFGLDRDTQWSYEDFYTFYVQSGGSTTITWRPHQRFDIEARGRHNWLAYEHGLDERAVLRTDRTFAYGGGIGFFIQGYPGTRLGLNVEQTGRHSVLPDRNFDTLRYYTQVGFSF
jgi:hypothetical protein